MCGCLIVLARSVLCCVVLFLCGCCCRLAVVDVVTVVLFVFCFALCTFWWVVSLLIVLG